jgi:hypothetical protein
MAGVKKLSAGGRVPAAGAAPSAGLSFRGAMVVLFATGAFVVHLRPDPRKLKASSVLRSAGAQQALTLSLLSNPSTPSSSSSSSSFDSKCKTWDGRMTLNDSQRRISISRDDIIKAYPEKSASGGGVVDRLRQVQHLTVQRYEKYLTAPPGQEHYSLLHYLVGTYGGGRDVGDCRHVVDIGTRYVASSLALGSTLNHPTKVWTFDLPKSQERVEAYRGNHGEAWQAECQKLGIDITFHNLNLLTVPEADFRRYMSTWLILLDTAHLPKTVPFEREFVQRLRSVGYRGLLLLDDIHLNDEMTEWWAELTEGATDPTAPYSVYDVTSVGHSSGTGLIDFSNEITVNL